MGQKSLWRQKLAKKVTFFFKCSQFWNRWIILDSKNGFGFNSMASNWVLSSIGLWCWQVSKNERFQIKEWYCMIPTKFLSILGHIEAKTKSDLDLVTVWSDSKTFRAMCVVLIEFFLITTASPKISVVFQKSVKLLF